jgi:prepilin-type N-terminal cleavage/methylation domain-containing protein
MLKKLNKSNSGFTIIEVLIVLAIAALILLIVFLAVPALQRNSRNTQRKNDVAGVLGAVSNYVSNNGGTVPTTAKPNGASSVDICGNAACTGNKENAKLGYYDPAQVDITATVPAVDAMPASATETHLTIVTGVTCNAANTGAGAPQNRTASGFFQIESLTNQCLEQ